jgi:hypothetical protein
MTLLACPAVTGAQSSAEAEAKAAVERFLTAAGEQDVEALAAMFAPGASIASASLRDGRARPLTAAPPQGLA